MIGLLTFAAGCVSLAGLIVVACEKDWPTRWFTDPDVADREWRREQQLRALAMAQQELREITIHRAVNVVRFRKDR